MSVQAIRSFEEFTFDQEDALIDALKDDFSVQSLVKLADSSGFSASKFEWERYYTGFIPHSHASFRMASNDDEIIELDLGEVDAVTGGVATAVAAVSLIAVAVAFVGVLAQAAVAAVNVAVAANIAWTVNVAWTSSFETSK